MAYETKGSRASHRDRPRPLLAWTRVARSWHLIALTLAALAGFLVSTGSSVSPKLQLLIAFGGLTAVCLIPPIVSLTHTRSLGAGPLYSVMVFLSVGLGALAWLDRPRFAHIAIDQNLIIKSVWFLTASMILYWLGYASAHPASPEDRDETEHPSLPPLPLALLIGLFIAGLGFKLLLIVSGVFGYLTDLEALTRNAFWVQWADALSTLSLVSLLVSAAYAFGAPKRSNKILFSVLLSTTLLLGSVSGFAGEILWPLFLTLLIYYYYRRHIPKVTITLAAGITLLIIVPANHAYRGAITSDRPAGLADTVEGSLGRVSRSLQTSPSERLRLSSTWAVRRFRNIDSVALVLAKTPNPNPFLRGKLYVQAPLIILVPRLIWPDKPVLNSGYQFSVRYMGLPRGTRTAFPVTQQGDLYMNFGLWGSLVAMSLWGRATAGLYKMFARRRTLPALIVYVLLLRLAVSTETDFVSLLTRGIREVGVAVIATALLFGLSATKVLKLPDRSTTSEDTDSRPNLRVGLSS